MTTISEGTLQLTLPARAKSYKFDDSTHGLSHCMKAVDFIVELDDRYLFVEFKDPQHPSSQQRNRDKFIREFLAGNLDEDFKYKYRDSFLYQWASEKIDKPIYYFVLVALDTLTEAELITRTDALKNAIPIEGPPSGRWKNKIVAGCAVFNINSWNKALSNYPVSRITP